MGDVGGGRRVTSLKEGLFEGSLADVKKLKDGRSNSRGVASKCGRESTRKVRQLLPGKKVLQGNVQLLLPKSVKNQKEAGAVHRKARGKKRKWLVRFVYIYSDIRHCNDHCITRSSRNSTEKLMGIGKELGLSIGGNES